MDAYLINPYLKNFQIVEHDGDYKQIQKLIRANHFDLARLPNGDAIYVDDEGLLNNPTGFFIHKDYPNPLAGYGLVLGVDYETGDSTSPKMSIEELMPKIIFKTISEVREDLNIVEYQ